MKTQQVKQKSVFLFHLIMQLGANPEEVKSSTREILGDVLMHEIKGTALEILCEADCPSDVMTKLNNIDGLESALWRDE